MSEATKIEVLSGCKFVTKERRPMAVNAMRSLFILLIFTGLVGCQNVSSEPRAPIDAAALVSDYERAAAEIRRRYDGKEIVIRGYAASGALMPREGVDQGSLVLRATGQSTPLTCWFSREQIREFSKIKGDQYIVVTGVFAGESGAELKFCKVVKVE